VLCWIGVAVITGIGGWRWSWLLAPAAMALGPAVLTWLILPRFPRQRRPAAVLIGTAGLVVTMLAVAWTPPSHGRIAEVLDRVELPSGWHLVKESEDGDHFCLMTCPTIYRTYEAPPGVNGVAVLIEALTDAGFEAPGGGTMQRGDVAVNVYPGDEPGSVDLAASSG